MAKGNQHTSNPTCWPTLRTDFKQSIDLLEKLLAESPDDPKIRRYLADALGLGGMGCSMISAMRPQGRRAALPPRNRDQARAAAWNRNRKRRSTSPRRPISSAKLMT